MWAHIINAVCKPPNACNNRNTEKKFGGKDFGDSWDAICLKFETDANLYGHEVADRLHRKTMMLRGDSLQYYIDYIKETMSKYDNFKRMISERFNNRAMQARIKTYLQSLNF